MKNIKAIAASLLTTVGVLGLAVIPMTKAQAQTEQENPSNVRIDDGARFLTGIESKDTSDWGFGVGGENPQVINENAEQNPYLPSFEDVDRQLEEQEDFNRQGTGDVEDRSVDLEVYDFD